LNKINNLDDCLAAICLIWLFTCGLFGIKALFDFIVILIGGFRDKANMPLK
jgi:hypothetical protein